MINFSTLKSIFLHSNPLEKRRFVFLLALIVFLLILIFYIIFFSSPKNFPEGLIYDLRTGETLNSLSKDFYKENIIKSNFFFKSFVCIFNGCKIYEGDYVFSKKQNVIIVAWRVSRGVNGLKPIKITIQEGLNSREIADLFFANLQTFDKEEFLKLAEVKEGYLFPDTYFVIPGTKESQIVDMMVSNFNEKIKSLEDKIKSFSKPLDDIIKMASIIEEEARIEETRKIISGILWNRISIGMPLQVDASFKYINGKTTKTLTLEDLKLDSPYNSYTNKGFPPTPISNPGLMAIEAAITPTKTSYLYFLTDNQGKMHYAKTHTEHVLNKQKYLR
jgi:UPF0755 protein